MANNTLLASDNFASGSLAAADRKRKRSREWMRKWRKSNLEVSRERNRKWLAEHPEARQKYNALRRGNPKHLRQAKKYKVQRVYGISLEDYEARLVAQKSLCALCHEPMDTDNWNTGRSPALDHDHETREVRQFIHQDCNNGIGKFNDDPLKLRLAAEYLEKYRG